MKGKRFLTVMLAAVMSFTGVAASFTASAEEQTANGSDVAVENNELTTESANSLGDLFSDQINEEMSSQDYNNGNYINSVEITDKTATVTYGAVMDCSLTVSIYDDSGKQMLTSETIEVLASETEATVEINIP